MRCFCTGANWPRLKVGRSASPSAGRATGSRYSRSIGPMGTTPPTERAMSEPKLLPCPFDGGEARRPEGRGIPRNLMIEHTGPETLVGPFPGAVPPARPVGFIEQWELDQLKNGCVARVFPTKDEPHDVAVFTHPEASAPGLSDVMMALRDALADMQAINLEVTESASLVGYFANRLNAITRASAATTCVACGGSPSAENNPCAVCRSAATVAEPGADERAACEAAWNRRYSCVSFEGFGAEYLRGWLDRAAHSAQGAVKPK
ncbi:hypothetical protein [Ralstonia phage RSK1]|uniref:Uncharacterized protein n=1 Tax=Ralstonia phage RSK1 TaxID=1417599 RepID=U6C703_9CAUD|nr:hypothetical protein X532_gp28 [Ralstonia phage RSK1]BAO04693.1 hypothetical protein [Ralstonia phage RSK1]